MLVFVLVCFALCLFWFCNHLVEEERASCFAIHTEAARIVSSATQLCSIEKLFAELDGPGPSKQA